MPNVSIFVVTYRKDFEFFQYFVRSYLQFASGFSEFVVACPHEDVRMFSDALRRVPNSKVVGYKEHPTKGHLKHQVENDKAEQYCSGEFIAHFDSDCLFTDYVTLDNFFRDGKPILWREKYEDFRTQHPIRYGWRQCVIDALGIAPEFEYMCRHPSIYPREIYPIFRQRVEAHTGKPFEEYVLSCKATFPYGFADYPSIGALLHEVMFDRISWYDSRLGEFYRSSWYQQCPESHVKQYWSHGGVNHRVKKDILAILSRQKKSA